MLPPADLEAVKDVAAAIEAAFRRGVGPIEEARAALTAALPHLTAAKDAEITRLRAERDHARNEYVTVGATLDHVTDRLSDMVDDAGLARPDDLAAALDTIRVLVDRATPSPHCPERSADARDHGCALHVGHEDELHTNGSASWRTGQPASPSAPAQEGQTT